MHGWWYRVGIRGGYSRVGGGGVYRVPSHAARGGSRYSEAGPVGSCREPEWVVSGCSAPVRPVTTPAGPGRPEGSLSPPRANAASGPIRARFSVISSKVSQNRIVSPKMWYKACHSPYFQNGCQKSALGFLRFPFLPAFSPKELMGLF